MGWGQVNEWLKGNVEGLYYLAGVFTVLGIGLALWSSRVAYRTWKRDLSFRAVEHVQWFLTAVVDANDAAKAAAKACPAESKVKELFKFKGDRPVSLALSDMYSSRGLEDSVAQRDALQAVWVNLGPFTRILNLLDIFAAKIERTEHDKETANRYCAVQYCDMVEDWAPLIAIIRKHTDTKFFQDGWALYLDWNPAVNTNRRPHASEAARGPGIRV